MNGQNVVKPHPVVTFFTFIVLAFDFCSALGVGWLFAVLTALSDHIEPDPNENQRLLIGGIILLLSLVYSLACPVAFVRWDVGQPLDNASILVLNLLHIVASICILSFGRMHSLFSNLLYVSLLANLALSLMVILRKAKSRNSKATAT